jgi:soluble lytic murein transglycosylase-like protein
MTGFRLSVAAGGFALICGAGQPPAADEAFVRSIERQKEAIRAMEQAVRQQLASVQLQKRASERADAPPAAASQADSAAPADPVDDASLVNTPCPPVERQQIAPIVQEAARRAALDEAVVWAVIEKESGFDPCAVSPKGALGLMQLMPDTARELGVSDVFDPEQNILGGARFLRRLLDRYRGDLALALGAYNAGPSAVDAAGGLPPFPETLSYVRWILSRLGRENARPAGADASGGSGSPGEPPPIP